MGKPTDAEILTARFSGGVTFAQVYTARNRYLAAIGLPPITEEGGMPDHLRDTFRRLWGANPHTLPAELSEPEPTDCVVMEGGPLDGDGFPFAGAKITFPVTEAGAVVYGEVDPDLTPGRVTYADSGRRDAAGRRVFVPE